MSRPAAMTWLRGALTLGICLLCGWAWSLLWSARLSHQIKFDRGFRTEMDELQSPISDSAFYLSYYYDVARAPSLSAGMARLLQDDRSEAPDTVNALHKFNVVPELLVAAAHRLLGVAESPFAFYVHSVVAAFGVGVAAAALTAALLGGSIGCSLAATSMFFSLCLAPSEQAGTRLGAGTVALREFWGVPALLVQNAWLVAALSSSKPSRMCLLAYAGSTCLFEVCWQFAPFVLLLQMLSLLGAHVLTCLPRRSLGEIAAAAVLGTLAALAASFGNRMLLCSPFFALACSIALVALAAAPRQAPGKPAGSPGGFGEAAWVLAAAVPCAAVSHQVIARTASEQEDSHVLQLLLQKLGLAPPDASFDAFLYLQSPEFGFLGWRYVEEAASTGAAPAAAAALLLIAVAVLRARLCPGLCAGRRKKEGQAEANSSKASKTNGQKKNSQKKSQAAPAQEGSGTDTLRKEDDEFASQGALATESLFLVALILLAVLVSRLRVLAAPILCIMGSLVASPTLWKRAVAHHWVFGWIACLQGVWLAVGPPYRSGALGRAPEVRDVGADADMKELVQWANQSLPVGSLLMADMTLAAKLRMISPGIRVANHPQYESLTSRERNRAYYRTFTCSSPERVHEVLSKYSVTHILLNANACRARIGKLDPFHEPADHCGEVAREELQRKTFCHGGFLSQAPGLFRMEFRNPIYTILRLGPGPSSGAPAGGRRHFDIQAASTWQPWLADLHGVGAARGLARSAARWPKMYGGFEVAQAFLAAAESLAPDDPIVMLQKGELMALKGSPKADATMEKAVKGASKAIKQSSDAASAREDLYTIFLAWKGYLNKRGPANLSTLRNLAKKLQPHLVTTQNAFDLCDLALWVIDWGDQALGAELWEEAKRASEHDQCVQEDWQRWEAGPRSKMDNLRAFLRL